MTSFIIMPKWILREIRVERRKYLPRETGGFLIGTRRGPHIDVTGLTRQGRGDVATYTSFERRCVSHRRIIDAAWKRSKGLESIVGDWHTHPHGSADASSIDRTAWRIMVEASTRTMIGLVDAGAPLPNLYFAAEHQRPFAVELLFEQEATDHFAFAIPSSAVTPRVTEGALLL